MLDLGLKLFVLRTALSSSRSALSCLGMGVLVSMCSTTMLSTTTSATTTSAALTLEDNDDSTTTSLTTTCAPNTVSWNGELLDMVLFEQWSEWYKNLLGSTHTMQFSPESLIHNWLEIQPSRWLVYCMVAVKSTTLPENFNHVSVFYELVFTDAQWSSYKGELKKFPHCDVEFELAEYGRYSFNFLITGDFVDVLHALKTCALTHGEPCIHVAPELATENFNDSAFSDYHLTYHETYSPEEWAAWWARDNQ